MTSGHRTARQGPRPWLVLWPVVIGALLVVACSSDRSSDPGPEAEQLPTEVTPDRSELRPIIEIGVTDWTAARLNVAIAEQLIERRLGYPVEAVEVVDTGDMLANLEAGELDAVLEIWPSALDEQHRAFFDAGRVEDLGELGVVGQIGWWVPRYVVDDDPRLATWEGLLDDDVAARFATPDTGPSGRFLGTDPGYEQHDEDIIESLGLAFEVVYSGSDHATFEELERAVAAGSPVLLYWWTPTAEITRFDLVNVVLPPRDEQCEADIAAGLPHRCAYPAERLFKAASPRLAETDPGLHRFLARFSLTTDDQLAMIDQVENRGRPVAEVAADWILVNQDRWEAWLE